jgi:hypothetical protein
MEQIATIKQIPAGSDVASMDTHGSMPGHQQNVCPVSASGKTESMNYVKLDTRWMWAAATHGRSEARIVIAASRPLFVHA